MPDNLLELVELVPVLAVSGGGQDNRTDGIRQQLRHRKANWMQSPIILGILTTLLCSVGIYLRKYSSENNFIQNNGSSDTRTNGRRTRETMAHRPKGRGRSKFLITGQDMPLTIKQAIAEGILSPASTTSTTLAWPGTW